MGCSILDPGACVTDVINGVVSGVFNELANWVGDAATALLSDFANQFASIPGLDLNGKGIDQIYGMSLGIAGIVAALLLMYQVTRTLWTRSGEPIVTALTGLAKVALAFTLTLTICTTAMQASGELTDWIIKQSSGNVGAFGQALGKVLALNAIANTDEGALVFVVALIMILTIVVLWAEMIMCNAALAVIVATSPISAAGLLADMPWWNKTVRAGAQLIILKPTVALIFALGFAMSNNGGDGTTQVITGLCILSLAVIAWPALAKFMSWGSGMAASAGGVGALLGFAAGKVAQSSSAAGGGPVGSDSGAGSRGESSHATGTIARVTAAVASGGTSAAVAGVAKAAQAALTAGPALMDQMAAHAGISHPTTRIGPGGYYPPSATGRGGSPGQSGGSAPAEAETPIEQAEVEVGQQPLGETAVIPVLEETAVMEGGGTVAEESPGSPPPSEPPASPPPSLGA